MTATAYPFELSRAELHWLAGAFGIAFLPLPDDAPPGLSPVQLESLQKAGHASLRNRGLIRPSPGFGWQVGRMPAALVQWIASALSMLRLERISKDGMARRLHLFTAGEQGLSLEMDSDAARFVIYESLPLLCDAAVRWLAFPERTKKTAIRHELPQPLTFLPAAWRNPSLAARILREHGLDAETVPTTLEWVASLDWFAALSRVKLEGNRYSIAKQFVLCGDGQSLWGGEARGQKVTFVQTAVKVIRAKIGEML